MPFEIKRSTKVTTVGRRKIRTNGFKVVNSITGRPLSRKPLSKVKALRQLGAVYRNVKRS
jgi:hypothetical protein